MKTTAYLKAIIEVYGRINRSGSSIKAFQQSIINKLKSVYNKVWNKQLFHDQRKQQNAGNKLRTYGTFKTNTKQEKDVEILDQKQRQILCKLSISSHDLEIEKGIIIKLN